MRGRAESDRARGSRGLADRGERGVAMLMVVVALTVTAVLTGALLGSREHSPVIGSNAGKLAKAKWSAESAANATVAAMGSIEDMMANLSDPSVALDGLEMGGAQVRVYLTNLEGDPPDADDRELILWAYAEVDGMVREVKKRLSVRPAVDPAGAVDLGLHEFAIFAADRLSMHERSRVRFWPLSPEGRSKYPSKLGVGFSSDADLSVHDGADLSQTAWYADADAGSGLVSAMSSLPGASFWQIPLDVPAIAEAPVPALSGLVGGTDDRDYGLGDDIGLPPGSYGDATVGMGATVRLVAGAGGRYGFQSLVVDGGTVIVSGQAEVIVEDVAISSGGSVCLADDAATLTLHLVDDMQMDGGSFGVYVADAGRAPSDLEHYVDPRRVRLYTPGPAHGGTGDQTIQLDDNSAVVACVHAPDATVAVQNGAAILGRVTASYVALNDGGEVRYCPALDPRVGFTMAEGPLYDQSGDPAVGLEDAIASIMGIDGTLDDLLALLLADWSTMPPSGGGGGVDVYDDGGGMAADDMLVDLETFDVDGGGGLTLQSPLGTATLGDIDD